MAFVSLTTAFYILLLYSCLVTLWKVVPEYWQDSDVASGVSTSHPSRLRYGHWVDTWTAAPQSGEYSEVAPEALKDLTVPFHNVTIRQTVQVTLGAEHFRLRLSNRFGSTELRITNVSVALPTPEDGHLLTSKSIAPDTLQTVTFSDSEWVTIPHGALAVSDPISFGYPINASQVITVSLYLRDGQDSDAFTVHMQTRSSAWMDFGDLTRSVSMDSESASELHWYFISAVETWQEPEFGAFAVVGDSISDLPAYHRGFNEKWPYLLFARMQEEHDTSRISVLNEAISGNELLHDSRSVNVAARIDRDILSHSGLRYVLVYEGINDIGQAEPTAEAQNITEARLIHYYKQIITRLHTFGIPVFGSTITPFTCAPDFPVDKWNMYSGPATREQTRLNVNEWIRTSGWFDAVVDFDQVFRDPRNATVVAPGMHVDCLHPSELGRRALAEHFPLEVFEKVKHGIDTFR